MQAQKALRAAVRKDGADEGGEDDDPGVEDQDRALREEAEAEEEKSKGKKGRRKGTGRGRGQKKKEDQGKGEVDPKKRKTEDSQEKKDAEGEAEGEAEASSEVPEEEAAMPAPSTPYYEEDKKTRVPRAKVRMTPTKKIHKKVTPKKKTPKGKKSLTGQARLNWFSSIAVQMHQVTYIYIYYIIYKKRQ